MAVEISRRDGVTILTLARPQVLNAINAEMADALIAALDEAEGDDSIAVVLTGAGRGFCAGTDLREPVDDAPAKLAKMHDLVRRMVDFPKLTIAALNGLALGGGLELAMGCALRIAHPAALLGMPEIKIAAIPCYGGTQLLPRLIGPSRALTMMLIGEPLTAAQAMDAGLVALVDDAPLDRAVALAVQCAHGRQNAQRAIRRAVFEGTALSLSDGLDLEQRLALDLGEGSEIKDAIAAFFAGKR
ncbi:MAG: enoyl-CoA hydratase/isomerase family protein, partial [Sphingobium sp.]